MKTYEDGVLVALDGNLWPGADKPIHLDSQCDLAAPHEGRCEAKRTEIGKLIMAKPVDAPVCTCNTIYDWHWPGCALSDGGAI